MRGRSRCHKLSEEHARWPFWAFALIFSLWLELGGPPSGRFRSMNEGFWGEGFPKVNCFIGCSKTYPSLFGSLSVPFREPFGTFCRAPHEI
jgi:hypothetical protein